jgi:ABC-2 type transport system permease protein
MTTTHATGPAAEPALAARQFTFRDELRAVHSLVLRELLRLAANPAQALMLLLQPLLFLLAFGGGLNSLVPGSAVGGSYRTFLFPGILLMTIQAPAISVGIRIITDRNSGVLRETLMAPARRTTLLCGICLGGCLTAAAQGSLLLALAPAGGLPYQPLLLLGLLAQLTLASFTLTSLGVAFAVRTRKAETFNTVLGLSAAPLLFTSGAFVPLSALPGWLGPLAACNPLSYAGDALRRTIHALMPGSRHGHGSGRGVEVSVRWGSWTPPLALETGVLLLAALAALFVAARAFRRHEAMV